MNRAHRFQSIYDLIQFIDEAFGRVPISCPVEDDDSDMELTPTKTWGNLRGGHLARRRQALDTWRYNCWKKNYRLCSWGVVGVMPDSVLSRLASYNRIKSIDDLLEAIPDWGYARKHGEEVLMLLKDADGEHKLDSQAQRTRTRGLNKKRKSEATDKEEDFRPDFGGPAHPRAPTTLSPSTRVIIPITVKHIAPPQGVYTPRPRPRPTLLVPSQYTRTDIFDTLMNI